ncbi:MAG: universal stress protein [Cocleimonas sp.]
MYKNILIPTDFSNEDATIDSLKKADQFSSDGHILLLHVLDVIPAYALVGLPKDLVQNQIPQTHKILKDIVEKSGVKADIEVREGSSYNQIIKSAEEHETNLIIINSHQPGIQDYLLGSTAAKVVRHAPCAVLVDR